VQNLCTVMVDCVKVFVKTCTERRNGCLRAVQPSYKTSPFVRLSVQSGNVQYNTWPTPVAARSKAGVCGRSLAGIVGLNPAGGMDVCLL